jgi:RNA polymerase sigma-70 factor (ECF subfamily)
MTTTPDTRFEALYAEHYGRVLGYVLRRAPASVAGDIVADVFVVAWRRLDRVPEEPLPWLLGVARRTLANERRGVRRRVALVEALRDTSGAATGETAGSSELRMLADAVERLGEADRELLKLIAWDGLTTRESAIVLGISHGACRVRLHRLRRRLARAVDSGGATRAAFSGVGRLDAGKDI